MENIARPRIMNAPFLNGERLAEDMGNLLVIAPHPDDESLGCGGLIAMLRAAGRSVSIIFVTSGSASHTSLTHPPFVLSKMRESEAVKACSDLGVYLEDIHFLRAPDSGLTDLPPIDLVPLVHEIVTIFSDGDFSSIAIPWRRDPHPDHRAVNSICNMALIKIRTGVTTYEYPIWLWKNGTDDDWPLHHEPAPYRLDITRVFQQKWRAIKRHRTQLGEIIHDDPNGFVLNESLLEPFNVRTEYFFVTRRELETLGKEYFENLYSRQTDPWNFRNSEYELGKYRRSVDTLGKERYGYGLELGCSIGIQTALLSGICDRLIAVDISETAVDEARTNCSKLTNVTFAVMDVVNEFPSGRFDLITCCEIGYYLTMADLETMFRNISERLLSNGRLLMVHWTPFVPDYPMSGDDVHEQFERFVERFGLFEEIIGQRHESYRLQLWKKLSEESER